MLTIPPLVCFDADEEAPALAKEEPASFVTGAMALRLEEAADDVV